MIAALIIWLYRKYLRPGLKEKQLSSKPMLPGALALLVILGFSLQNVFGQQGSFNISQNGNVIGKLDYSQKTDGANIFYKISSKVSTRFVFKINVETEDEAHFLNGKLISSSVYRKINGKDKALKKTNLVNDTYQVSEGNKFSPLKANIQYNMMMLYNREPVNIRKVYSDNYQCFLDVKPVGPHLYRIDLPDGNYNEYHFNNNICQTIIVSHSMYTIKMERV